MKKLLIIMSAGLTSALATWAANPVYYYDVNGTTTDSGVTNGGTYIWNTSDSFWNSASAGDGSGSFSTWMDAAALGLTPGTTAAAQGCWQADFSAGAGGQTYTVSIPSTDTRDVFYLAANKANITVTGGTVRPQGINTYNAGFAAISGVMTLSNLTLAGNNCHFYKFTDGGSYNGSFIINSNVNVAYKGWNVAGYTTVDFGNLLNNNLIFTTNYPGGGRIAVLFFTGYSDNEVIQGNGLLTVGLANWYSGPFPCLSWNPDGYGNGQGGGFAARGGKLTINLWGDGRTVTWNGNGNPANYFCGKPFSLIFNSSSADSEVEFQNGIDLSGYTSPNVKVLSAPTPAAFATISGVISDSVGGGTLTKADDSTHYSANGTLILSGANTYAGPTVIKQGKLYITSAHLGGGEFDVYGNVYNLSGFGVKVTSSAVTVPMSALNLDYTSSGYSNTLDIIYSLVNTNGAMLATNFNINSATTINVSGSLPLGQFPLIRYGSIGGNGFAGLTLGTLPAGVTASLVDNSGNSSVDLKVTAVPTPSIPNIINVSVSGGSVNFTATNGTPGSSCVVLSATNLALPLSGWTTNTTTTFDGNGVFHFSSPISGSQQIYRLKQ